MGSLSTNIELYDIAYNNNIPLTEVISKNEIKDISFGKKPIALIINLADADKEGSHWVSLVYNKGTFFYFDSFGLLAPTIINNKIQDYVNSYIYNTMHIQNIRSGYCGSFCLAFIEAMFKPNSADDKSLKERYQSFIDLFDTNPEKNLTILKQNFKHLI